MKVALSFPGVHRRAGVERVAAECARFLARQGHEVDVFTNDFEDPGLPNVHLKYVPMTKKPAFMRPISFYRSASKMLRPEGYDAIGSFGAECPCGGVYWAQSVYRAWLEYAKQFRPPMSLARWKQRLNPSNPVLLAMESNHFRKRKYRKVIALSPEVKADLKRFYSVPDEDVVVLANGFAPEEFNPQRSRSRRAEMRARLGYVDSDRVVVFAANELERKGFGPLMRAMARLNYSNAKLLVVGRVKPDAYVAEMQQLKMSDRVQFVGSTPDVAAYYAAADIFALPTQYEAWGLVIIEAMACGLPVLTSRLAGAAIAVHEGHNGLLLDAPADSDEIAAKLKMLLDGEHDAFEAIGESVMQFTWDNVLLEYERILVESFAVKSSAVGANVQRSTLNVQLSS
jgi:UDP-glucose:(heptosyl)LPS alpha-1,3-glucosyltransferase